jgi:hypothetical protein
LHRGVVFSCRFQRHRNTFVPLKLATEVHPGMLIPRLDHRVDTKESVENESSRARLSRNKRFSYHRDGSGGTAGSKQAFSNKSGAVTCLSNPMRHVVTSFFVALWLTTATVAAEVPDCSLAYQGMLGTIERKKLTLSAEAHVALQRMALRLYDACLTGHLQQPGELFDKLDRTKH